MRRVLVTGGSGFVGRHVVAPLRDRGFEVHVIGRIDPHQSDVIFHEADILNFDQTRRVVAAAAASHLLHLAWTVEPGEFWRTSDNLNWLGASLNLIRSFVEKEGRRAVVAGTCAEYQWSAERLVENETPCDPATLYGASKDALHRILSAYSKVVPLSLGWGRVFFMYGRGEKPGRLVGDAIRALLSGRQFPTSDGYQRRDFMHVADVAGAFAALVDSEVGGPVNIGSGTAVTIRSILEQIALETGNLNQVAFGARSLSMSEPPVIEADSTRLLLEVGYRPRYELGQGIADAVAWWRTQMSFIS